MKRLLPLWFALSTLLASAPVAAQTSAPVTFKVFPADYELFSGGERQPYRPQGDGLRVYTLPTGPVRVSLSAAGTEPLTLSLEVKAGLAPIQAKLEPRGGLLTKAGEAPTGSEPRSVAFSADGKKLYVALHGEAAVQVFEVPSLKLLTTLTAPGAGTGAFTDAQEIGGEVWAVRLDGTVVWFDPATGAVKASAALTGGGNAFLTPLASGGAAAANWDNLTVQTITADHQAGVRSGVPGLLRGLARSSTAAWATLFDQGSVVQLDPATWKVKATYPAGKAPRAVGAAGSKVFVGDMGSAQVLVLDAATGKRLKTVDVASNPHQMAVSADEGLVAVASRGRNNPVDYLKAGPEFGKVTLFDGEGRILASVWGRNQPTGLAFAPTGKYLAFTDYLDNNVELYRINGR